MILKLSLDLPDDVCYVPLTRHFGRGLLEFLTVIPEDIGDVETIINELVTNVIRHAKSESRRFQIGLEFYAKLVVISVVDAGNGFTFRDIPEVGSVRPDLNGGERLGGFGLPLLDALTDLLEFHRTDPHGTTVRAEKHLRYASQEDADKAEAIDETDGEAIVGRA